MGTLTPFAAGAGITNIDLFYGGLPRIPGEGEEVFADSFSVELGGGVVMTLITVSRLGIPVRAATYLGSDMFSLFAGREMEKRGVTPLNLYESGDIPLSVSAAALTERERTFISYVSRRQIGETELERVYRLCSGARAALMQPGYLEVYRKLKREGTLLFFDPGWDEELSVKKYRDYLETADYYTPNRKEALRITGTGSPEDAARRLSDFFGTVIIKLDREGCLVYQEGSFFTVSSIPEFSYVDSTGAGDAFLAGFLYGVYHRKPPREAALMGNLTGGKCVSARGCLSAWLDEAALLGLTEKYRYLIR
jgi:sugar/nucleoside kinase (ribokinase family)